MTSRRNLSIVIPAYNEESGIGSVLNDVKNRKLDFLHEVIVVDDGSTDRTAEIVRDAQVRLIRHPINMGYGASIKSGLRTASTDYVLIMDADGQHSAENIIPLWNNVGDNDMVVGKREKIMHSPAWRMPGKWALGALADYIVGRKIPDLNSGFRIMKRDMALSYAHLYPSGFSFSTTNTLVFLCRDRKVVYMPISIMKRIGKSNVRLKTGLDTFILILRIASLFNPLKIYLPISAVVGVLGVLWGVPYAMAGRGISVGSLLLIVTSLLFFCIGLLSDQISQLRLEKGE